MIIPSHPETEIDRYFKNLPTVESLFDIQSELIWKILPYDDYTPGRALGAAQLLSMGIPPEQVSRLYETCWENLFEYALQHNYHIGRGVRGKGKIGEGIVGTATIMTESGPEMGMVVHFVTDEKEDRYVYNRFDISGNPLQEPVEEVPIEVIEELRKALSSAFEERLHKTLDKDPNIKPWNIIFVHCAGCYATLEFLTAKVDVTIDTDKSFRFSIENLLRICPCCLRYNFSDDNWLECIDQLGTLHFVCARPEGVEDSNDPKCIAFSEESKRTGRISYSKESFKREDPTYGRWPIGYGQRSGSYR